MGAIEGSFPSAPEVADATPEKGAAAGTEPVAAAEDAVEYDRRGVALPRRARVGGIITPQ